MATTGDVDLADEWRQSCVSRASRGLSGISECFVRLLVCVAGTHGTFLGGMLAGMGLPAAPPSPPPKPPTTGQTLLDQLRAARLAVGVADALAAALRAGDAEQAARHLAAFEQASRTHPRHGRQGPWQRRRRGGVVVTGAAAAPGLDARVAAATAAWAVELAIQATRTRGDEVPRWAGTVAELLHGWSRQLGPGGWAAGQAGIARTPGVPRAPVRLGVLAGSPVPAAPLSAHPLLTWLRLRVGLRRCLACGQLGNRSLQPAHPWCRPPGHGPGLASTGSPATSADCAVRLTLRRWSGE
jgi:hypothetical protein